MALSFFDYNQLAQGTKAGEEDGQLTSTNRNSKRLNDKSRNLRINVPELKKLRSETALRAHAKGLNSPLSPRTSPGQRPTTSRTADLSSEPSHAAERVPLTSAAEQSNISTDAPEHAHHSRSSSRDKRRDDDAEETVTRDVEQTTRPSTEGEGKRHGRARSRAKSLKSKSSQILRSFTSRNEDPPPLPTQAPPVPPLMPALNERQAQYLAGALAHATVGEWLYKDPSRPRLVPMTNYFRRQTGPPSRGSTGLPQRRWFRISPYDRKVMWSSKWDATSAAQYKTYRQVPIDLVFEAPANVQLEYLPKHLIPFGRSIVILARQRIVKLTAPDEERHQLWLTALRYISESTVKLDEDRWATDLRARFEVLTSNLSIPERPATPVFDEKVIQRDFADRPEHRSGFFTEKPLPPSPPESFMRPPVVPRIPSNILTSGSALSMGRSSDSVRSESRRRGRSKSIRDKLAESIRGRRSESVPVKTTETEPQPEPFWRPPQTATTRQSGDGSHSREATSEGRSSDRQSLHLESEEVAADQMDMLLDRMAAI